MMKKYLIFAATLLLVLAMATTAFAAQNTGYTLEFDEASTRIANFYGPYEYEPVFASVYDAQGNVVRGVTITYTLMPANVQNTTGIFEIEGSVDMFEVEYVNATATVNGVPLFAEIPVYIEHIHP